MVCRDEDALFFSQSCVIRLIPVQGGGLWDGCQEGIVVNGIIYHVCILLWTVWAIRAIDPENRE